jgi:hypothetical protein
MAPKEGIKRGVVIGNCQTSVLAKNLNAICRDVRVSAFQVHLENPESAARLYNHLDMYDFVLSMPLSGYFKGLSSDELRQRERRNVEFITNIYFSGLQPDFTFIGRIGERHIGPLGNYHSKIVLGAFLVGLDQSETMRLFCGDVYSHLDYYSEFRLSKDKLQEIDQGNTVRFADEFFQLTFTDRTLLTFNHPSTVCFLRQSIAIAEQLRNHGVHTIGEVPLDLSLYSNELADGPALPIYPEIAQELSLPYASNYIFKTATSIEAASRFVDLEEYVTMERDFLAAIDPSLLLSAPQAQAAKLKIEALLR